MSYSGLLRKQILINITNSIRNVDMIILEDKLEKFQKFQMNEVRKRLRSAEKEMCVFTPREFMKVIEEEVLENWESSSYQNITMAATSMSIEQRRLYEEVGDHIIAGTFEVEEKGERKFTLDEMKKCFDESRISDKILGYKHFSFEQFLKNEINKEDAAIH